MAHVDIARLRECFPSLADPQLLEALGDVALPAKLSQDQTLCELGQECSHLALVTDGSARIFQLAESGREITLYRVGAGECCILTASCIMSQRYFPAIAVSEQPGAALLIPARYVDTWMAEFAPWRKFLWTMMADRLSSVLSLLEEVTFQRVDQRLIAYLLKHSAEQGERLFATHQTIADDVGTSREVVSRILKDLEHRQFLSLSRGQLLISNRAGLIKQLKLCD